MVLSRGGLPPQHVAGAPPSAAGVRLGTPTGRWIVAAAVLGSGVAFLDGTVVNAALPAIAKDLGSDLSGLQWILTGYLLTLGSLLVLGGSLGDLFGRRRVFVLGLAGFSVASLLCGVAPTTGLLVAARCVQGVAAAALVPGSLAVIAASFCPEDRPRAIGAWSGLAGLATALGPFVGGWVIDSFSWRLVFLVNLPLAGAAIAIALRHVPETSDPDVGGGLDVPGAVALAVGLGGIVFALIEGPAHGWPTGALAAGAIGAVALVTFALVEVRSEHPMVPLSVFRSRQFSGVNAVTLFVYGALSATTFLLVVHLQQDLGYSALEAGASLLPVTALLLAFSARSGALAQRIGPRLPMTVGPILVGLGLLLFSKAAPGRAYVSGVLPGVIVLGLGLTLTVAPLTSTAIASIDAHRAGVGSAINNAVARIAGLLAIAVLPAAAGISQASGSTHDLAHGFTRAMVLAAALAALGGVLSWLTIRSPGLLTGAEPPPGPSPGSPAR